MKTDNRMVQQPPRFILHTKPSAANPKSLRTLLYPDREVTIIARHTTLFRLNVDCAVGREVQCKAELHFHGCKLVNIAIL